MELNRQHTGLGQRLPIKVVQFGEGNFLRGFVDYAFQQLNDKLNFGAGVAVVQPIAQGLAPMLNAQDGLYHLMLKGIRGGEAVEEKHLISNIVTALNPYDDFGAFMALAHEPELAFVVSNTTEAGICWVESDTFDMQPQQSFPAKLTRFLYERFRHFDGATDRGLCILPCELIEHNADTLRETVLRYTDRWQLPESFRIWLTSFCSFHNTLVDRIVPGFPREQKDSLWHELGYTDNLMVVAETFFLWVIEGDDALRARLPFAQVGLDVKIVPDLRPYRTRKVRILNGAHTTMVPVALMHGLGTVKEAVEDGFVGAFVRTAIEHEIVPVIDMDKAELLDFTGEVMDRFRNPYIKHQLASIALNSISKFAVRVLPSLLEYQQKFSQLPLHLSFALACTIRFYQGQWQGRALPVQDDQAIADTFAQAWQKPDAAQTLAYVLPRRALWGTDLSAVPALEETLGKALGLLENHSVEDAFAEFAAWHHEFFK